MAMPPSPSFMPAAGRKIVRAARVEHHPPVVDQGDGARRSPPRRAPTGAAARKSHRPQSAAHETSKAPSVCRPISTARATSPKSSSGTATGAAPAARLTAESGEPSFHSESSRSSRRKSAKQASAAAAAPPGRRPPGSVTCQVVAIASPSKVAKRGVRAARTSCSADQRADEPAATTSAETAARAAEPAPASTHRRTCRSRCRCRRSRASRPDCAGSARAAQRWIERPDRRGSGEPENGVQRSRIRSLRRGPRSP